MTSELVKVVNGGAGGVASLDPAAMLSAIRTELEGDHPPLMDENQSFMIAGAPLQPDDEATTPLSDALSTAGTPPVLTVGDPIVVIPTNETWVQLTTAEQLSVLNTVAQVTKGLTIGNADGGPPTDENSTMFKTTRDSMEVVEASWMTSEAPRIQTAITSNSYFSKFAESMSISSSNSTSASVSTPYGGGSASYSYAESHSHSSSKVSTYSVGTYNVNIAVVEIDQSKMKLTSDFQAALSAAVSPPNTSKADMFIAIVQALNKYGWYLPGKFTVGGVLYTTQSSESSSWSDAQTTSTTFGGSFKASFDGIGGGAAYKQANKSGTTSSGSTGSSALSFTAIGGSPADSNDYAKWSTSMLDANNWNISNYLTLIPSIYPLYNMGTDNRQMLVYINNMIASQYAISPELGTIQPMVDCGAYSTAVRNMLPGFG